MGPQLDEIADKYSALADDNSLAPKCREAAMLIQTAEMHLSERGDHEGAMTAALQALEACRDLNDYTAEADAVRMVVHAYRLQADVVYYTAGSNAENSANDLYDEAEKKAKEYLTRFKNVSNKRGQGAMTLSLAEIADDRRSAYDPDQIRDALNLATSAKVLFHECGDKKMEGLALMLVTIMHYRRFAREEAYMATEAALANFRAIKDRKNEAKALHLLGYSYFLRNELEEATRIAQEASAMFREQQQKFFEAFESFIMAEYYLFFKKGRDALPAAEDSLEMYQQLDFCKGWQAHTLDQVVQAHLLRGDERRALTVAQEAVETFEEKNDKRQLAIAWHSCVEVYMAQGEGDEALKAVEEEQSVIQDMGDQRWEAGVLLDLATVHMQRGTLGDALTSANEAVDIYQSLKDRQGEALAMNKLNEINLAKGDDAAVTQTCTEQRAIFQELEDKSRAAGCQLTLSGLAAASGRFDEAMSMAEEACEWLQEAHDKEGEARALHFMAQFHSDQGEYDAAVDKVKEMRECLHEFGHRVLEAGSLRVLCEMHLKFEEPAEAVRAAHEGLKLVKKEMSKKDIVEFNLLVSKASMALINKESGGIGSGKGLERALRPAKEALTISRTLSKAGRHALVGSSQLQLSQVLMLGVRVAEAMVSAREAVDVLRAVGDKAGEAAAVVHIAEIHYTSGAQEKALDAAKEGLDLAKDAPDADVEKRASDLIEKIQGRPKLTFEAVGGLLPAGAIMAGPAADAGGAAAGAASAVVAVSKGLDPDDVSATVQEMAKAAIGLDEEIFLDSPLMDSGLDSLTAVSFRNGLQQQLGVKLPSSLMFDYPTMKELSSRIVELSLEDE